MSYELKIHWADGSESRESYESRSRAESHVHDGPGGWVMAAVEQIDLVATPNLGDEEVIETLYAEPIATRAAA